MANLNNARTIFAFTSPRTIEKIIPEIQILIEGFEGAVWETGTQEAFFKELFSSDFYLGKEWPQDPAFAARDRITRAPKALGFVDLNPVIRLTPVGQNLLSGKRTNEVIAKQLMKFQLPSPYHTVPIDRNFNIRPYLELLRFIKELGRVSKTEIAIFFVQLTNYRNFDSVVSLVTSYRASYAAYQGNKKEFIDTAFNEQLAKVYANEIAQKNFKGREDNDKTYWGLIDRKKANQLDYADALIRYLRATELISFDKNFRVIISPVRSNEVDYLLANIPRQSLPFKSLGEFKAYLFDPNSITLFTDNKANIEGRLKSIGIALDNTASLDELKDTLEESEAKQLVEAEEKIVKELKGYKEYDDILHVFDRIKAKAIPDAPLYLEWNIWRSFVMMNYNKRAQGNFKLGLDGLPVTTAGAKLPDIEVDFEGFKLIVEVTMSSGQKQYVMEGEPVARHFGDVNKSTPEPVYCIFIAPTVSEGTLAHYFTLNNKCAKYYWKSEKATERYTNIIPMTLDTFRDFIASARANGFKDPQRLKAYLDARLAENRSMDEEDVWFNGIVQTAKTWA